MSKADKNHVIIKYFEDNVKCLEFEQNYYEMSRLSFDAVWIRLDRSIGDKYRVIRFARPDSDEPSGPRQGAYYVIADLGRDDDLYKLFRSVVNGEGEALYPFMDMLMERYPEATDALVPFIEEMSNAS